MRTLNLVLCSEQFKRPLTLACDPTVSYKDQSECGWSMQAIPGALVRPLQGLCKVFVGSLQGPYMVLMRSSEVYKDN